MAHLLTFVGGLAAGYALAIYTWPAVRAFFAGAEAGDRLAQIAARCAAKTRPATCSDREADMDWSDLAKTVIALGAPVIGQALAGPLGAAAGHLLAQALGVSEATPSAVNEAIVAASPNAAAAAALLAEQKWAMAFGAEADAGKAQVVAVGETQRAEMTSDDLLQRWWRPLYALELSMLECPAFAAAVLHVLWTGFAPGHQRLRHAVGPADGLFRRALRRARRLCQRPLAREAGRRHRPAGAGRGHPGGQGGDPEVSGPASNASGA